jgi:hypothetical protein
VSERYSPTSFQPFLRRRRIGSIPWEGGGIHPISISNIISSNSSHRDRDQYRNSSSSWGMMYNNDDHYGIHIPTDATVSDGGVAFVYNKGPAGQTPFPTLVAMPGYFPLGQVLASTPPSPPSDNTTEQLQLQQQEQAQRTTIPPYSLTSQDYAQPSLDSIVLNDRDSEPASAHALRIQQQQ